MKLWMIGMVLGIAVGAGCGGEDSPEDKCRNIGETFCSRFVSCLPATAGDAQDCEDVLSGSARCSSAKSIGDSYDSCISQLDSAACGTLFHTDANGELTIALPTACAGVVHTALGAPDLTAAAAAGVSRMRAR